MLFYDLTKAFDSFDRSIFLMKLNLYNFSQESISLWESYLADRKQMVMARGVISAETVLIIGVAQGSVLRPIMFLIIINELATVENQTHYIHFAEETKISAKSLLGLILEANNA